MIGALIGTARLLASRAGDLVAPAFFTLYGVGFLVTALVEIDRVRSVLVGSRDVGPAAAVLLTAAVGLLAWRGLAARSWMWHHPAALTWSDRGDERLAAVRRRLGVAWGTRLATVMYTWALASALAALPTAWWITGWVAVLVVGVAVLVAVRPGTPRRRDLVAGWRERSVRHVAVRFLDPLSLITPARPLALSLAGASLVRFLVLEGHDRGTAAVHAALLLLLAVAVLQIAPALPSTAVLAGLGYAATLPAAAGLGRVWRNAGLRRWSPVDDHRLRAAAGALVGLVALGWCGAVAVLAGAAPVAVLAVPPLIAVTVVRTVARPPLTITSMSPTMLVVKTLRGLDLLAVGALALVVIGI